jgi:hypothetical protein
LHNVTYTGVVLSQAAPVYGTDSALFARRHHQVIRSSCLVRQQPDSSRANVFVVRFECCLVEGSEGIHA